MPWSSSSDIPGCLTGFLLPIFSEPETIAFMRCDVNRIYTTSGVILWLLREHVAPWQRAELRCPSSQRQMEGDAEDRKMRLAIAISINDPHTLYGLVECGFQVEGAVVIKTTQGEPATVYHVMSNDVAEQEHKKLVSALKQTAYESHFVEREWPMAVKNAEIDFKLLRKNLKLPVNEELEEEYLLVSTGGVKNPNSIGESAIPSSVSMGPANSSAPGPTNAPTKHHPTATRKRSWDTAGIVDVRIAYSAFNTC